MKLKSIALAGVLAFSGILSANAQLLPNGGFETTIPIVGNPPGYLLLTELTQVPSWQTTSTDGIIEIWTSGFDGGNVPGIPINASTGPGFLDGGQQFAELNGTQNSTIYQEVVIPVVGGVDFFFLHRGRASSETADVMRLTITYLGGDTVLGGGDDVVEYQNNFAATNVAWIPNAGNNVFTSVAGGTYRFSYAAISSAGPDNTYGNFIDNAAFGVDVVPEPGTCALLAAAGTALVVFRRRYSRPA